jgi:hypothetical protein
MQDTSPLLWRKEDFLEKARDLESNDTMEEFKWKSQEIPAFSPVLEMLDIPG